MLPFNSAKGEANRFANIVVTALRVQANANPRSYVGSYGGLVFDPQALNSMSQLCQGTRGMLIEQLWFFLHKNLRQRGLGYGGGEH